MPQFSKRSALHPLKIDPEPHAVSNMPSPPLLTKLTPPSHWKPLNEPTAQSYPWRTALHISNRGDAHTLATIPTDSFTSIENRDFEIIFLRRLLLPTTRPVSENFKCARCHKSSDETMKSCPDSIKVVDLYGNHAISCMKNGNRTDLWHDAVRRVTCWLARRVGLEAEEEKSNILVLGPPGMRADVVVHKSTPNGPLCITLPRHHNHRCSHHRPMQQTWLQKSCCSPRCS